MAGLTPLDTIFLLLEDVDEHIGTGIGVIATVAGPAPSREEFTAQVALRISRQPQLFQRLRRAPRDVVAPRWTHDDEFDLAHHIRRHALPEPGDERALDELVAAVMTERLDRDHPLWRCHVVECPGSDHWVMILVAHHSMVDGLSGISMLSAFCDDPPAVVARSAAGIDPVRLLRDAVLLPVAVPRAVLGAVRHAMPVITAVLSPGAGTSLNGPLGRQRRYRVVRVPLAEVRAIGAACDATVNDVALAVTAAGLRTLLDHRGESAAEVRVLAPVSVRAPGERLGNRVSLMLPRLPVAAAPVSRQLARVRGETRAHKASGEAGGVGALFRWSERLPFVTVAPALRLLCRFPQRSVAGLVTDVFGPPRPLTFAGRAVRDVVAIPPIAMRLRTGIAVLSYAGTLSFGILADHDTVPDLDVLADGIEDAVHRLRAAATQAPGGPPPVEFPVPAPAPSPDPAGRLTPPTVAVPVTSGKAHP